MSRYSTEISVEARYAELTTLQAEIAGRAIALALLPADTERLQLIVEELFINTIMHGYGGDSSNRIHLFFCTHDNAKVITIQYRDGAPAFDILCAISHIGNEKNVGGVGIELIRGLSKAVRYRREDGSNITEFDL